MPAYTYWACTIKKFNAVIIAVMLKAKELATAIHFLPSLIFADKTMSLILEWSSEKGSTLVCP
jgi:hypothetical protein